MGGVNVSIPAEQIEFLVGSDLLKLLGAEERRSLLVEAIKNVLGSYEVRSLVVKAIKVSLENAVACVAVDMKKEIETAVRESVRELIRTFPARVVK